jgi:hypothetical protein
MSFDLKEYYSNLSEGDVILAYKGSITSDLINDILEAVEARLEESNEESRLRKRSITYWLKVFKTYTIILNLITKVFRRILILNSECW